jgi:hypothetical protein
MAGMSGAFNQVIYLSLQVKSRRQNHGDGSSDHFSTQDQPVIPNIGRVATQHCWRPRRLPENQRHLAADCLTLR